MAKGRQPNGAGTLYKKDTPSGLRWKATYNITDESGKRREITGTGKTAQEALERRQASYERYFGLVPHKPTKRQRMSVGEWLREWHKGLNPEQVNDNVRRNYLTRAEKYLIPFIGSIPLHMLSREQIDELFSITLPNLAYDRKNPDKRLSRNSIVNVWRVLSIALNKAQVDEALGHNPLAGLNPPKRDNRTRKLNDIDFGIPRRIMRSIEGEVDEARWLVACLYGLRQSERLGLRWQDIHGLTNKRANATMEISGVLARKDVSHGCGHRDSESQKYPCGEKVASRCHSKVGGGGFYWRAEAKNATSERLLPIVEPLKTVLKEYKKLQDGWKKSPDWKPMSGEHMDDLVFTSQTGKPIRQQNDTDDWHELLDRLKIPYINGHKLRHLVISELAKQGTPMATIQAIVGHSKDSKITQAVYTHINTKSMVEPLETYSKKIMSERTNRVAKSSD